jgi:hypothetical protein
MIDPITGEPTKKQWDAFYELIKKKVGEGNCIDKLIIRGHGNATSVGWIQLGNFDQGDGMSDQEVFLIKLSSLLCNESAVDLKACYCAQGETGEEFLTKIAGKLLAPVSGWTDMYAMVGHGQQKQVSPFGEVKILQNKGSYETSIISKIARKCALE